MINSKNELKRKLTENKDGIKFRTIENHCNAGGIIQTNAFTIETYKENGEKVNSWTLYKDIDIKNNMIIYKNADIKIEILEVA